MNWTHHHLLKQSFAPGAITVYHCSCYLQFRRAFPPFHKAFSHFTSFFQFPKVRHPTQPLAVTAVAMVKLAHDDRLRNLRLGRLVKVLHQIWHFLVVHFG